MLAAPASSWFSRLPAGTRARQVQLLLFARNLLSRELDRRQQSILVLLQRRTT